MKWDWQLAFDIAATICMLYMTFILTFRQETASDVQTTGLAFTGTSGG